METKNKFPKLCYDILSIYSSVYYALIFVIFAPYDWGENNPTFPWKHDKLQAGRVFSGDQASVRTGRGRFDLIASAGAGSSLETRASNEP